MRLTAREAKNIYDVYYQSLVDSHAKEYEAMKAEKRHKINVLKKSGRYDAILNEIEEHIKRISSQGGRSLEELEHFAYYLKGENTILWDELIKHFTSQGFRIKEYADFGLQLQW